MAHSMLGLWTCGCAMQCKQLALLLLYGFFIGFHFLLCVSAVTLIELVCKEIKSVVQANVVQNSHQLYDLPN